SRHPRLAQPFDRPDPPVLRKEGIRDILKKPRPAAYLRPGQGRRPARVVFWADHPDPKGWLEARLGPLARLEIEPVDQPTSLLHVDAQTRPKLSAGCGKRSWSMSATMTAQIVTDALVMAIWRQARCLTAANTQATSSIG